MATNDGSVILSCKSTPALYLIQPRSRLDYSPPRASLITSMQDCPKKTKQVSVPVKIHSSKQLLYTKPLPGGTKHDIQCARSSTCTRNKAAKALQGDQKQRSYYEATSRCFGGIGKFPGPPYTIHLDPSVQPKQTPCRPVPMHLKETFKQEIDKMLQAGVLKPVTEVTPWINSFVLVESKDKVGNHKLRICLDPTNLKKAIIREPYHFKTPEDIAHLIARACTLTVLDW